jgi:zinc protease
VRLGHARPPARPTETEGMTMLWKRLLAATLAAMLSAPALPALAQRRQRGNTARPPASSGGGRVLPPLKVEQFTLANGLRVILHEDHSTPIVGVNVWYHVGSKNEVPGRTGFAHLFEHMMFQGSKNYDNDFFKPLQEAGAVLNGSTNPDRTNYWEVLPSNFLELAIFMEADRMGGLLEAMTEEKLANQRDVVKNEKRQNYDNRPYGLVGAQINSILYPPEHPYHWLTIGSLEDLTAASMEDVKDFFRRYYVPNNASLVIAGDFNPAEARRLVEKHFGPIPKGAAVGPVNVPQPKLDKEVRIEMDDRVQLPRVHFVWHTSPAYSKDEAALDTLAEILGGGKSSRLYKSLVYEKQIAQQVSAFNATREIAGQFQITVTGKPNTTPAQLEEAVNAELARLKTEPPTAAELERSYNAREASFIYGLQTVGGFGGKDDQLNAYATYIKNPNYFEQDLARYRAVKLPDLKRVSDTYLTDKRLVLTVVPRASGPSSAAGPAPSAPREGIAAPPAQTAGQQPAGSANAAAQTTSTGTPQSATQGSAASTPAGAQTVPRTQAAASQPAGAAPPTSAAPGAAPRTNKKQEIAVDTSKLPKPGPVPKFTLPPAERRTLSNGMDVLVVRHHELPIVAFDLVVKMGAAGDPAGQGGLASLTADLMDEGTATRSALEISDQLTSIGTFLGVNAGWDSTTANMLTLKRHLDRALDIYADVLLNPSFAEKEMQRLRDARLASFRQRRDDPAQVASIVYTSLLYGDKHPYGHPLTGDESSVRGLTAADARKFYETFYRPNNATLIVVGDTTADEIVPKLEKAFGKWEKGHIPAVDVTAAPVRRERPQLYIVDRPGSAQSVIQVGHVGVPRSNPDFFPLLVLNTLLGGQFTSRINLNLREDKGYTYGARSSFDWRRGAGPFTASAPVFTKVTKESLIELMKELKGVRGEIPVTPTELEYAKQAIIRGFPRTFETPGQIADRLETVVTYALPETYFNTYIERVQAVTLEDVNRVANQHLRPGQMAVVIVGDRRQIEQALRTVEDLGENITFLDTDGRPAATGSGGAGGGTK